MTLEFEGLGFKDKIPTGITGEIQLLSITIPPTGSFDAGNKYYNSTDKLIYTAVTDDTWDGAIASIPLSNIFYTFDNEGTTEYYQWDGENLVEVSIGAFQLKANMSQDYKDGDPTKYPSSKALSEGLQHTSSFELLDIKTNSEPLAQKGWSCISYPTQNKLNKSEVPTVYNFLNDKLINSDGTIDTWFTKTSTVNSPSAYLVNDTDLVLCINDKLYKTTIYNIGNESLWEEISLPFTPSNMWVIAGGVKIINDIIVVVAKTNDNGYGGRIILLNKNTFEIIKCSDLDSGLRQTMYDIQLLQDGYIYVLNSTETGHTGDGVRVRNYRFKYSLNADEITFTLIRNYNGSMTNAILKVIGYYNNKYYYVRCKSSSYRNVLSVATDITDVSTQTDLTNANQHFNYYYFMKDNNVYAYDISQKLYKLNSYKDWEIHGVQLTLIYTFDFTVYGSGSQTADKVPIYFERNGLSVFCFNKSNFNVCLYSYNLKTFNHIISFTSSTLTEFSVDTNTRFATYCTSYSPNQKVLNYSAEYKTLTVFTDTYTINNITTNIKYYKNGDIKICTPDIDVNNDTNLQTVYEFLGYLNYFWIDTTNEQITLQRNSNMWTMMYVGDDYEDKNLPIGNNIKNKTVNEYIENSSASITLDIKGNQFYKFTNNAITDITIDSCDDSIEETTIKFTTGNSAPTLTDNSGLVWFGGIPTLLPNTTYVIVIFNKQAFYQEN